MTREQMEAHERWISQPVKVLFPRWEKGFKQATCRWCKRPFTRKANVSGKARLYCTERCRDAAGRPNASNPV